MQGNHPVNPCHHPGGAVSSAASAVFRSLWSDLARGLPNSVISVAITALQSADTDQSTRPRGIVSSQRVARPKRSGQRHDI